MKLTPVVDFTNILRAAFMLADPKSAKNTVKQSVFFLALLGSACVKAGNIMLVKLTPGLNRIKICFSSLSDHCR